MNAEPTPYERELLAIEDAERRHTPRLAELGLRIHSDINYKFGPVDCDGKLEVVGVSAAYHDYGHVEVMCTKCRTTAATANPRRREKSLQKTGGPPAWKQRKDAGDGADEQFPF